MYFSNTKLSCSLPYSDESLRISVCPLVKNCQGSIPTLQNRHRNISRPYLQVSYQKTMLLSLSNLYCRCHRERQLFFSRSRPRITAIEQSTSLQLLFLFRVTVLSSMQLPRLAPLLMRTRRPGARPYWRTSCTRYMYRARTTRAQLAI